MRIIILGNCNSVFVKNYIATVFKESDEVILLAENPVSSVYADFYNERKVRIVSYAENCSIFAKIPLLRSTFGAYVWSRRVIKQYGNPDIVHVHGLNRLRGEIAKYLRPFAKKVVISVWGSELLGRSNRQLESLKRYYSFADAITCENQNVINAFRNSYGSLFKAPIYECLISSGIVDYIKRIDRLYSREEIMRSLNFNCTSKINVFVGHNGRSVQNHFMLTAALGLMPDSVKDKINLVYTMTYGVPSADYLAQLKIKAIETGCSTTFIEGYLSEDEVAKLRLVCDILVHAQPTDGASASLRECLYCGAIVINGDWLPYDNIPDYHSRVIEYSKIEELTNLVTGVIDDYQFYKDKYADNRFNDSIISSTNKVVEAWQSVINII